MQLNHDANRTAVLNDQDFTVMRFWNNDVLSNLEGVLEKILEYCGTASPSPQPFPIKGGGAKSKNPSRLRN
jgi:very-short-patch-repair endonuclease